MKFRDSRRSIPPPYVFATSLFILIAGVPPAIARAPRLPSAVAATAERWTPPAGGEQVPRDGWLGGFGLPGINNYVNAVCEYNGLLIAGGNFDYAGGEPATDIAAWDGHAWTAIG